MRKRGQDVPSLSTREGVWANTFWEVLYRRDQSFKLELLTYIPMVLFGMLAPPNGAEFSKRITFLQPFTKRMQDAITQRRYDTTMVREDLRRKQGELRTRQKEMLTVLRMGKPGYGLDDWIKGRI